MSRYGSGKGILLITFKNYIFLVEILKSLYVIVALPTVAFSVKSHQTRILFTFLTSEAKLSLNCSLILRIFGFVIGQPYTCVQ